MARTGCRHVSCLSEHKILSPDATTLLARNGTLKETASLESTKTLSISERWICMGCFREWNEKASFVTHGRQKQHLICWVVHDAHFFCAQCNALILEDTLTAKGKTLVEACTAAVDNLLNKIPPVQPVSSLLGVVKDKEEAKIKSTPAPLGLENLGNTCFMNSTLQSLAALRSFYSVLSLCTETLCNTNLPLSCALSDLLGTLLLQQSPQANVPESSRGKPKNRPSKGKQRKPSNRDSINPCYFFDRLAERYDFFERNEQQDSHDFLRLLFNALDDEWDTVSSAKANSKAETTGKDDSQTAPHRRIFGGTTSVRIECKKCGHRTSKTEASLDISLSIVPHAKKSPTIDALAESFESFAITKGPSPRSRPGDGVMDIVDLLGEWTSPQELTGEDAFACENCYKRYGATEGPCDAKTGVVYSPALCRYSLSQPPQCLLLHLQRFSLANRQRLGSRKKRSALVYGKNHTPVRVREELSLGGQEYRLKAMVMHEGTSAESGHYVALVERDGSWFHSSDSSVSPIAREAALASHNAYLIFYESCNQ